MQNGNGETMNRTNFTGLRSINAAPFCDGLKAHEFQKMETDKLLRKNVIGNAQSRVGIRNFLFLEEGLLDTIFHLLQKAEMRDRQGRISVTTNGQVSRLFSKIAHILIVDDSSG